MKQLRSRMGLAVSALVLGGAAACGSAGSAGSSPDSSAPSTTSPPASPTARAFPLTIDAANGKIAMVARPTAIVSLSPTATEMLYAIGAGSQVKAVDESSDYPPNAPRTKLDGIDPNIEAIVAYRPDLVLIAGDSTGLTTRLRPFGIPVLSLPAADTLGDVYQQIAEIGKA